MKEILLSLSSYRPGLPRQLDLFQTLIEKTHHCLRNDIRMPKGMTLDTTLPYLSLLSFLVDKQVCSPADLLRFYTVYILGLIENITPVARISIICYLAETAAAAQNDTSTDNSPSVHSLSVVEACPQLLEVGILPSLYTPNNIHHSSSLRSPAWVTPGP